MDDLNENTFFPESAELPKQEIARWKERAQEKEEKKERKAGAVEHRNGAGPERETQAVNVHG